MYVCVSDLVFTPQQAVVVVFDAGADEVHAVVLNSKVKISKPEHHPGRQRRNKIQMQMLVDEMDENMK